eukprot:symbB.v1.2.030071.t1/scaffold3284.1/size59805/4
MTPDSLPFIQSAAAAARLAKADLLILLTPEGVANLDIPMHAILEKHGVEVHAVEPRESSLGQSAIGMLRFITSPLLFLPFLHYLNAACVETKCETEDVVTMQLAMIATTTTSTTSTTLSAPKQTVTFKSKGGYLWPFVAKNFREAREEAHAQLHMKGWLQADKLCEADCTTPPYDCCFQFFLVGSALSKEQTKDDDDVPDKGASLEVGKKHP